MPTTAQLEANRLNARMSTGPRTPEGKAISSRNHTSHGFCSKSFIVLPGQEAEFESLISGLHDAIQPQGALEADLFHQLAHASWTLRRCQHAEAQLLGDDALDPLIDPRRAAQLSTIDLFSRRAERAYHRTLKALQALQTERQIRASCQAANEGAPAEAQAPLASSAEVERHIALYDRDYTPDLPPAPALPSADELFAQLMQAVPPAG